MNRLIFVLVFTLLFQFNASSQDNLNNINNYKYIIVPDLFDFQKSKDEYQLNALTKFLFNKYGFQAFIESETFPDDLESHNCLGLKALVKEVKGGFLSTRIQIDLVDCKNNVVATSKIGSTKEKDYGKAYNIAIRQAFETFQFYDYNYNGSSSPLATTTVLTASEEAPKATAQVVKKFEQVEENHLTSKIEQSKDMLYAQPLDNGFQIVDTEPKKVMILLYSGVADMFIVQGKDAVVYKKADQWIYAENNGENLTLKGLNLKF